MGQREERGEAAHPQADRQATQDREAKEEHVADASFGDLEATLRVYFAALAAGEWDSACSYLSAPWQRLLQSMAESEGAWEEGCPQTLERRTSDELLRSLREDGVSVEVASVQERGGPAQTLAVVIYRDAEDASLRIAMSRERGGPWRVAMAEPRRLGPRG